MKFLNANTKSNTQIPIHNTINCALLIFIGTLTFTKVLYLTNFPIAMMFKSSNFLFDLLIGVLCTTMKISNKRYFLNLVVKGLIIIAGLLLFSFGGTEEHRLKVVNIEPIMLLLICLLSEGFLFQVIAEIKTKYKSTTLEIL